MVIHFDLFLFHLLRDLTLAQPYSFTTWFLYTMEGSSCSGRVLPPTGLLFLLRRTVDREDNDGCKITSFTSGSLRFTKRVRVCKVLPSPPSLRSRR